MNEWIPLHPARPAIREWYVGKQLRFGLQYVNYSDPNLARHYKRSFLELRDFMDEHLDW